MNAETVYTTSKKRPDWNYVPHIPVPFSPLFDWPPRPIAVLRWFAKSWLKVSMITFDAVTAFAIYYLLQPTVETMQNFAPGWIAQIWLRNILLMFLVAGGLHLYLYTFRKQGKTLKYEPRELERNSRIFTFRNQVLDNMFWTVASGVTVWTAYEVVYFWAAANGYVPRNTFMGNPVWFILMFILIPIWTSFHFYCIHRLLHWPPLFRIAHALHHRNVNIGPWSGISMHPIEHVLYLSSLAIHFVVASHPIHFLFHAYDQALGPAPSHSGFDGLYARGKKRVHLGVFFHQLHHKHFKCNYGTVDMPWDRWFNSYHDGTEEASKRIRNVSGSKTKA